MAVRRILLFGSSGQIGYELRRTLSPLAAVTGYNRDRIDVSNLEALRRFIRTERPDVVVNAAAYTAVDRAESEPDLARRVNAEAPGVLAEEARQAGALFVHFSTDYVFDGAGEKPYTEGDAPNPLSVYGRTKLEGEQAVQSAGGDHLIFRTSWVYGGRGRNFLLTMKRLANEREELRVVDDQFGAPTWSRWIAEMTAHAVAQVLCSPLDRSEWTGIYHLTAGGHTTWYDFAGAIIAELSEHPGASLAVRKVVPISTAEYPAPAVRPPYSVLSNQRLERTFGLVQMPWQDQLALCISDLIDER